MATKLIAIHEIHYKNSGDKQVRVAPPGTGFALDDAQKAKSLIERGAAKKYSASADEAHEVVVEATELDRAKKALSDAKKAAGVKGMSGQKKKDADAAVVAAQEVVEKLEAEAKGDDEDSLLGN